MKSKRALRRDAERKKMTKRISHLVPGSRNIDEAKSRFDEEWVIKYLRSGHKNDISLEGVDLEEASALLSAEEQMLELSEEE
jgi:hypothetical protein